MCEKLMFQKCCCCSVREALKIDKIQENLPSEGGWGSGIPNLFVFCGYHFLYQKHPAKQCHETNEIIIYNELRCYV